MSQPEPISRDVDALLHYLKINRGFDFTAYKPASLMRRIQKRMQTVGIDSYAEYLDHLQVHPDEFPHLFNTILINVTGFFRDSQTWEYLAEKVIPDILASKGPEESIRVWSAGCASGEEAYSVAILFAEALGDAYQDRVKIYATDLDEEALNDARQATYGARDIAGIPPNLLEKYFELVGARYIFRPEFRRSVIFGRHDLFHDAPISRVDLLLCRNTLMYFNAEAQGKILARLHFALSETGYLFLGKAEMLFSHGNLFTPVELRQRVFSKVLKPGLRERLLVMSQAGTEVAARVDTSVSARISDLAFEADPLARVVVDAAGSVVLVSERARFLFGLTPRDIGRPLQDLEISYRPVELRSCIDVAYAERRPVILRSVEWRSGPDTRFLDVQVIPLIDAGEGLLGVKIIFEDVTRYNELQKQLQHSKQELETAYEELQSTNEELVTTNEELQSTVEELETTNEELQSTNEELETMNEELQSTNEELQTINEELRQRTMELHQVNVFLESILASLRGGVIVVDRDLRILIWNRKAEDLWGLRADEVRGGHLLNLDIGLSVDDLKPAIRSALVRGSAPVENVLLARNRRGKEFRCRVTCTPFGNGDESATGVILIMEDGDEERTGPGQVR